MAQQWHDLLFAHWPIPVEAMRAGEPRQLDLDLFDDRAWLAVVPFVVRAVRARLTSAVPVLSAFAELNVRTYVRIDGRRACSSSASTRPARRLSRRTERRPTTVQ